MQDRPTRKVSDSRAEQSYFIRPQHINHYGRLFGGTLLAWMDELAGIVARRHSGTEVTTACIDQATFVGPAKLNDLVVLEARITYVGRSSMEIRVDNYTEDRSGTRIPITRGFFVMVAIDDDGKPLTVPGLELNTVQVKEEFEMGHKRYLLRKERKQEGY